MDQELNEAMLKVEELLRSRLEDATSKAKTAVNSGNLEQYKQSYAYMSAGQDLLKSMVRMLRNGISYQ